MKGGYTVDCCYLVTCQKWSKSSKSSQTPEASFLFSYYLSTLYTWNAPKTQSKHVSRNADGCRNQWVRHEIFFYFFTVVFVKGALPSKHHQNSLEGLAAFWQSTFCWQAGDAFWEYSQLNKDCCQAEKTRCLVWDFEKETLQPDQDQKSEKMVWDFSRVSNPCFCGKEGFFFSQIFLAKNLALAA